MDRFPNLLLNNIDLWSTAIAERVSGRGRVSGSTTRIYGVEKLRHLILQLAVSGRLTISNESSTFHLNDPCDERGDAPFKIPSNWRWSALKDVGLISTGKTPDTRKSEFYIGETPFIGPGQLTANCQILNAEKFISKDAERNTSIALPNTILMVCIGGSIGKSAIVTQRLAFNQQINAIQAVNCNVDFIHMCMRARFFQSEIQKLSSGAATPIINKSRWGSIAIPIPPIEEQNEIVRKVQELLLLCDELESKGTSSAVAHESLVKYFLEIFLDFNTPKEFEVNWQNISKLFDVLFTSENSIDLLKTSLLQLAFRGKLSEQYESDGLATDLLDVIGKERAHLPTSGESLRKRKLSPLVEDHLPEIPSNWVWTQNDLIGHDWGQKTPLEPFLYIDVSSIDSEHGVVSTPEVVLPNDAPSRARKIVKPGSVIYSTIRPYLLNIAIIDDQFDMEPIASTAFVVVYPRASISSKYIYYYLRSPLFIKYVESVQAGIAYPAINDAQFYSAPFPLPPLSEQHRIVAILENLLHLCDSIKTHMRQTNALQRKIADALVEEALT